MDDLTAEQRALAEEMMNLKAELDGVDELNSMNMNECDRLTEEIQRLQTQVVERNDRARIKRERLETYERVRAVYQLTTPAEEIERRDRLVEEAVKELSAPVQPFQPTVRERIREILKNSGGPVRQNVILKELPSVLENTVTGMLSNMKRKGEVIHDPVAHTYELGAEGGY